MFIKVKYNFKLFHIFCDNRTRQYLPNPSVHEGYNNLNCYLFCDSLNSVNLIYRICLTTIFNSSFALSFPNIHVHKHTHKRTSINTHACTLQILLIFCCGIVAYDKISTSCSAHPKCCAYRFTRKSNSLGPHYSFVNVYDANGQLVTGVLISTCHVPRRSVIDLDF